MVTNKDLQKGQQEMLEEQKMNSYKVDDISTCQDILITKLDTLTKAICNLSDICTEMYIMIKHLNKRGE